MSQCNILTRDVFLVFMGEHSRFTQPLMYQRIKKTKPILEEYTKMITASGVADETYVEVGLEGSSDSICIFQIAGRTVKVWKDPGRCLPS